jgi:hypothetical protein
VARETCLSYAGYECVSEIVEAAGYLSGLPCAFLGDFQRCIGCTDTAWCALTLRPGCNTILELVGGNDELSVGVAAHAIDRAGGASANRKGVATWMFGSDGDGTIRAANDGTFVVKGVVLTKVNNETGVLGTS